MKNELITLKNGQAVTDTYIISVGVNYPHKNVIALCRKHIESLKKFGGVEFIIQPFETAGGTQKREVAILNEDQATLLMALMQNNETVVAFKVRLIQAFRDCRNELAKAKAVPALPDYSNLSKLQILHMAIESEEQRIATEKQNEELTKRLQLAAPKVSAYNDLIDDQGTYNATAVAKILHMKRCDLFTWFKSNQVAYLQKDGWLPYSTWEKKQWALVKITEGNNKKTGEPFTSQRLRFTVAGIFQMHKMMQAQKINVPEQLNLNLEGATA